MSKFISAEEYCIKVFDGTHDTPKPLDSGFPLVTSKHIVGRNLDFSTAYFISENDYNSIQKRSAVSQWDVLFSMIGSVGEVYLEKNSIIPYAIKNIGVFSCGDEFKAKWLYYFLQSPHAITHIKRYLNGAVQKFLPLGALRNFPIFEFNKNSKIITKVLSDIDAKIELNNRINRELEAMAKTLYDYWFVQFDFPNADGKPYKSSGGKMLYNAELKREIPEGWENGTLGDISDLVRGVTYDASDIKEENDYDVIPILRATNISGNVIDLDNMVFVPKQNVSANQVLNKFDILITMSSGSKDHIGKNGFFYFDKEVAFGAFCAKIVAKDKYRFYVYSYTQSDFMFSTIKNECLGTNINNLNGSLVKGFKIVIPPDDLVEKFNDEVLSIYEMIGNNHKQNQQLSELRDWLLPMLMNGQVTVGDSK